ncbi:MAG TPA: hypothetical protein IAC41_07735 [Candidatus Merdenecus merdavium]|nr:hypothetical protein [Candidatus Merdenecus merdavium]
MGYGNYRKGPEYTLKKELDLLKNLDQRTLTEFISYEDLYGLKAEEGEDLPSSVMEVFHLFFENFNYKIKDTKTINDAYAFITVQLTTLDAKAVAKEYYRQIFSYSMTNNLEALSQTEKESTSLYFVILRDILKSTSFDTVTKEIDIKLVKKYNRWTLQTDSNLEDQLVGGFVTYVNHTNLFTPEETVDMIFSTWKKLTAKQLLRYMGFHDIFSTADEYSDQIDLAIAEQILNHLDYEIISSHEENGNAVVSVQVTSLSLDHILSDYADSLIMYAATSEALISNAKDKAAKINELLLHAVQENTAETTTAVDLILKNDGRSWNLELTDSFIDTILGGLNAATESFNAVLGDK